MKKHLLLLTTFSLSLFAMAQQKPSFGIRGGYVSSRITGEANQSLQQMLDNTNGHITTSSRSGFGGSAYVSVPFGKNLALEPSLGYAQKGYVMRGEWSPKPGSFFSAQGRARLNMHYIDLPVLLKGTIGGLEVFAGPQVSYLAGADLRTTAGVSGFNMYNRKRDVSEEFKRWDGGLTGGIGYQFANGLSLRASYDRGLSRVDADDRFEAYNEAIKVGIGYRF